LPVAGPRDTLEFRILGPLEVLEDGRALPLGGKRLRALLAALLLHVREVRTVDQLIDDLWADNAPASARASLHNMLTSLRRTLGPGLLETTRSGYVLVVGEDAVDASRFERLVARARGQPATERVRLLEQAIALWRGSPLVDVRYEEFAQSEIRRLEELRVSALEELLGAKLDLGACEAVVPELQRLVDDFPFREQVRMQLMIALHRSGRSVEALSSYVDWRRMLMDSWGIEPGRAIRQLWDDIRLHAPDRELATTVG
jgi:SARP family transcriptional regulator, regulator of embCAB operon